MSSKRTARLRKAAARKQAHRCYYCGVLMADNVIPNIWQELNLPLEHANWLRCTAEHLVPKSAGGNLCESNIVAACMYCNNKRSQHRGLSHQQYKEYVKNELRMNRWYWTPQQTVHLSPNSGTNSNANVPHKHSSKFSGLVAWGMFLLLISSMAKRRREHS